MPFSSKNPFKTPREAQVMTSIHQGGEWGDGGGGWWNSQTMWVSIANWRREGIHHHLTFSAVCILLYNLLLVNKIKITQIKILFVKICKGLRRLTERTTVQMKTQFKLICTEYSNNLEHDWETPCTHLTL